MGPLLSNLMNSNVNLKPYITSFFLNVPIKILPMLTKKINKESISL